MTKQICYAYIINKSIVETAPTKKELIRRAGIKMSSVNTDNI